MAAPKRKKCRTAQKRKEAAARFKDRPSTGDDQALKRIFPTVRLRCNRPPVSQKEERKNWKQLAVEQLAADVVSKEIVEHFRQNDPASLRRLLEVVDRTKRNFLRFRLWKTFKDCIPAHDRVTPLKAIRCDVTHAQCRALLAFALNFVFGGSLLSEEESRSLAAALVELLLCPRREHFLTPLDLNCFRSLLQHPIEFAVQFTKNTRKLLAENIVLFVVRHCLKILSQCFYATPATSPGGTLPRLALYRRNVWHKIERFSFEKLKMRQALREVQPLEVNDRRKDHPYSDLRFLPKAKGTRPIGICRSIKNRWELRAEKLVLRYLYQRRAIGGNYVKPLYRIKQEIVKVATAFGDKKVFCFHGDLLDCFNRIDFKTIQQFLMENVSLDARYYVATVSAERRTKKGGRKVLYAVGRTKEEADRSLNAYQQRWRFLGNVGYSKGSPSCSSSNESSNQFFIPGEKIRRVVREYAARPWIKYKGKMYEYGRGILQGSPLSDTLNEIYQIMKTRYIFEGCENFFCRRYVDDYFLMSDSKDLSKTIHNILATKPGYRPTDRSVAVTLPRFSTAKITANFKDKRLKMFGVACKKKIAFCGSVFDPKSKSFTIDHQRYHRDQFKRLLSNCAHLPASTLRKTLEPTVRYFVGLFVENYALSPGPSSGRKKREFLAFLYKKFISSPAGCYRRNSRAEAKKLTSAFMLAISRRLNRAVARIDNEPARSSV